ncbi:hypothetical protein SmJEL517_g00964 [Synchytrium microbalum]|uniref:Small monomeric GTPase n=1 Tax=Synchytrium microbalum TaxID=1806994 RepID=A0A507CGG0_9FUNG|nr:uncharacterized protein SmJEL517_g00964 [Synchytrium microbalum]TPX37116.1 hypothetical protein SmJEL517_g00964 [Synchytrium microbalum]
MTAVSEANTYDFLFKFVIVGHSGSGKSALLQRFVTHQFKAGSSHTVGIEFGSKVTKVGNKSIKLQIWDSAGQERFRAVTRSYWRGAAGCLLVYDITNRESFEALSIWLDDAKSLASPDVAIVLVGAKVDMEEYRVVSVMEANTFAQEHGLMFVETSALSDENVEEAFMKGARSILHRIDTGEIDPDRLNSGIQYGQSAIRTLPKEVSSNRCCGVY